MRAHTGEIRARSAGGLIGERLAGDPVAGGAAEVLERLASGLGVARQGRELPARRHAAELMERVHGDAHGARRDARLAGRDDRLPVLVPAGRDEYAGDKESADDTGKMEHGE